MDTKKKNLLIGSICVGVFLLLGIMTYTIGEDSDEKKTNDEMEQSDKEALENWVETHQADSVVNNPPIEGDPYEDLEELFGLEEVKEEVHSLANFVKVQKKRVEQGLKTPKMSYHLVFTGSPGTGKTTVARIVARIYKDLGILKKGHTVETDRSGLVAEYIGQTAVKTNQIVDSAMNGVLFIDEAYALVPEDSRSDFGQEAISTLLKRMEDNRDSLVVIIAGYSDEMKRFIDSNPGLQSRFNRYIKFPDYTGEELSDIFTKIYMKKNQYTFAPGAADYLHQRMDSAVLYKSRNFGNARFARNLFEKSIQQQANRVSKKSNASPKELSELTIEDLSRAFATTK